MSKQTEALKLALEALEANRLLVNGDDKKGGLVFCMDGYYSGCFDIEPVNKQTNETITAIREALAEQPAKEKAPQSANCEAPGWINSDHARIDDCTTDQAAQQELVRDFWYPGLSPQELRDTAQQQEPEPDRVKFERHWRKTRGDKKANRELPRHPLQPQTYIQDSANRHWVTWQAAVRSVFPPACKPLTEEQREEIAKKWRGRNWTLGDIIDATEAAHGIKENKK